MWDQISCGEFRKCWLTLGTYVKGTFEGTVTGLSGYSRSHCTAGGYLMHIRRGKYDPMHFGRMCADCIKFDSDYYSISSQGYVCRKGREDYDN